MSDRARILNTEVLRDVKAAMTDMRDSILATLASVDAEIARTSSWLNQQQLGHWKRQVRRQEDEVNKRKMDVARKRLIAAPEPASVVEEQKNLNKAKARLAHAQRKYENVRRWAPVWEREALLYKTATGALTETLARDIPVAIARLERMLASLEEYHRLAAPKGDIDAPAATESEPQQE
jgi:transposase-like protein